MVAQHRILLSLGVLCKPFGSRKCELTCGRNMVNMLANESDQMAVRTGSLCKFIEGDLAPEMAAEEQWPPRYEIVTLGSLCTAD